MEADIKLLCNQIKNGTFTPNAFPLAKLKELPIWAGRTMFIYTACTFGKKDVLDQLLLPEPGFNGNKEESIPSYVVRSFENSVQVAANSKSPLELILVVLLTIY